MKKSFLHIVFACSLLFMASGLQLSLHYCGATLVSVEAYAEKKSSCCGSEKENKEEKSDCCKNEVKLFQIEEVLQQTDITLDFPISLELEAFTYSIIVRQEAIFSDTFIRLFISYIPPPLLRNIPIFFQQFRL